jgi:hypothetical protein
VGENELLISEGEALLIGFQDPLQLLDTVNLEIEIRRTRVRESNNSAK